jgi:RNA polymerase sigma-70 factor (ECF subfamily)
MLAQTEGTSNVQLIHEANTPVALLLTDETPPCDFTLMQQIAAGDDDALEQLYQRYASRLASYLSRRVAPEFIDEVVNDVMLVVWQRAACFQPTSSVSTWIFGIARNKAYKAMSRSQPLLQQQDTSVPEPIDHDPEYRLQQRERDNELVQVLQLLPVEQRMVVQWTYDNGWTAQEISQRLGISADTVRSRLKLARRRLACLLAASQG